MRSELLATVLCIGMLAAPATRAAASAGPAPESASEERSSGPDVGAPARAQESPTATTPQTGSFLGAYAASNDNVLDDANAYVGITVTRIVDNSPAQALGLQVGDILLQANGVELDAPERLDQVLAELPPGYALRLRVERDARVRELTAITVPRLVAPPLATTATPAVDAAATNVASFPDERRIERRHLGFEFRAAPDARLRALGQPPGFGVEVLRVASRSPLVGAGVQAGDVILAIEGRALPSPDTVVAYFDDLSGVSEVELEVIAGDGARRELEVPLHRPERTLTRLSIPGVFSLQRGKDTSEYSALLGAFRWTRLANGSRLRLFWLVRIETGAPDELIDMGADS